MTQTKILALGTAVAAASAMAGYGVRVQVAPLEASAASAQAHLPFVRPLSAAPSSEPTANDQYVKLANQVMGSVVNISALTLEKPSRGPRGGYRTPEDMFEEFFGRGFGGGMGGGSPFGSPPRGTPRSGSLGTGFVIDEKGIILTNHHVVAGADEIKISFTEEKGEKAVEGKVIGRDPELDIALIQVKTDRKLTALPLGDSDALQVGEYVAAVGNPFGQGHSLTHGIISAKGRLNPLSPLSTWLQTDAPINPGNSGGPLLNLKGEVVGINNAIDARAQGIGFAIPVNVVKQAIPTLQSKGTIARGYLGVVVAELTPDLAGQMGVAKDTAAPLVTQVEPGGPAYKAGVRPYDLIQEFNGKKIETPRDLTATVVTVPEGRKVPLKVSRDNRTLELTVQVGKRPVNES